MPNNLQKKPPLWLLLLVVAYLMILTALTIMNHLGADRWWFGALNLYLPQAVWAAPGIFISFFFLVFARKWVWIPLLCVFWVFGPVMGFCWPVHAARESAGGSVPLRVMTWNVKYGSQDKFSVLEIIHEIDLNNPAIIFLQDAGGVLNGPLGDYFKTWHVRSFGQYIVASKHPLGEMQVRYISFMNEQHTCIRTQVELGGESVALYNVHFATPRFGLNAMREVKRKPWYLPDAIRQLENSVNARHIQVRALQEYVIQEKMPVIVAGDLNSPDDSLVCRTLRVTGLHDAFAEGGKGYGYTYGHSLLHKRIPTFNVSWMRIDHIMMSKQFQARSCRVGTGSASAHRPVVADLVI